MSCAPVGDGRLCPFLQSYLELAKILCYLRCPLFCNFGHLKRMCSVYWKERSNCGCNSCCSCGPESSMTPCILAVCTPCPHGPWTTAYDLLWPMRRCQAVPRHWLDKWWHVEAFLPAKLTLRADGAPCTKPDHSEITVLSGS